MVAVSARAIGRVGVDGCRAVQRYREMQMDRIARSALSVSMLLVVAGVCLAQARPARGRAVPGRAGTTKVPGGHKDQGPDVAMLMKVYAPLTFTTLDGRSMQYRLLKPNGYTEGKAYPLVVCLHGIPGEGRGNSLQLRATYPAGVLARPEMRRRYPSFVLVPQSPNWWGDKPYGNTKPKRGRKHFPSMTVLLEMVDNLGREFGLDPNRLYVTGHAMGGFGAFNALKADPNMWAGAVVVSGGGDPNSAASFSHVPVWVFAGEKSPILRYPRAMANALKAAGGSVTFTILAGAPTKCWPQVYDSQAAWDWLFSQRRQPRIAATTQPGTQPTTGPAPPKPGIIYTDKDGTVKEYRPGESVR